MKKGAILLVLVASFLFFAFFFLKPSLTGFTVYEVLSREWDFSNHSDYTYNSSALNLSSGLSLAVVSSATNVVSHTTNRTFVSSAYKIDDDEIDGVIDDLIYLDDEWVNIGKDDVLNLSFGNPIVNISGYIDPNKAGIIRICSSPSCSLVYGSFSHGTANSWFSVSGIPSVSAVYVDGSEKVEFDYIEGNFTDEYAYSVESNSYASSGEIETGDFSAGISSWGIFSSEESLNGGNVEYYYSTDSGLSWSSVSGSDDLSSVNSSKIRFKAVVAGDGSSTPVISTFAIGYSVITCSESWSINYGGCLANDSRLIYYSDSNDCGTSHGIPADNGTYAGCDYCIPSWVEVNGSCLNNDSIISYYEDVNSCFSLTGLPADNAPPANKSYNCNFCSPLIAQQNSSCNPNDLFSIGYSFGNSCCSDTGLESDCAIPSNITDDCDYCIPSWVEVNETCMSNDSVVSHFIDSNSCFNLTHLSSDNSVPESRNYACDFCTPGISYFNTSCMINDTLIMYANDSNDCYSQTSLAADVTPDNVSFYCDYCSPVWNCSSYSACSQFNSSSCQEVNDVNGCFGKTALNNDSFSGNISVFDRSCVYDSDAPNMSGYSLSSNFIFPSSNLIIFSNFSDSSNISAAFIAVYDPRSSNSSMISGINGNGSFSFVFNTSILKEGIYLLKMAVSDNNNNSANFSLEPFVVSNSSGTVVNAVVSGSEAFIGVGNASLMLNLSRDINGSVVAAAFSGSIKGNSSGKVEVGKYLEIVADDSINSVLSSAQIKMYYDETDISGIDEETLSVFYYNDSLNAWQKINSSVNSSGNYVDSYVSHLSFFGLFGDRIVSSSVQSSGVNSGSGGGGSSYGGGSNPIISKPKKEAVVELASEVVVENNLIPEPKKECDYSISADIPHQISFGDNDTFKVGIFNSGTCILDEIEVKLDGEIKNNVNLTYEGDILPALLSLKSRSFVSSSGFLGGFAVKSYEKTLKNYSGEVVIVGKINGSSVAESRFPVVVAVQKLESINSPLSYYPVAVVLFVIVLLSFLIKKK